MKTQEERERVWGKQSRAHEELYSGVLNKTVGIYIMARRKKRC